MESLRQQSHTAFITGLIALVLTLALLGFSVYTMPYLVLNWRYEIPAFVVHMVAWLQMEYHFTPGGAAKMVFSLFAGLCLMMALIAYLASNYFDDSIDESEPSVKTTDPAVAEDETPFYKQEWVRLLVKMIVVIALVFMGVELFHWLISSQPT